MSMETVPGSLRMLSHEIILSEPSRACSLPCCSILVGARVVCHGCTGCFGTVPWSFRGLAWPLAGVCALAWVCDCCWFLLVWTARVVGLWTIMLEGCFRRLRVVRIFSSCCVCLTISSSVPLRLLCGLNRTAAAPVVSFWVSPRMRARRGLLRVFCVHALRGVRAVCGLRC